MPYLNRISLCTVLIANIAFLQAQTAPQPLNSEASQPTSFTQTKVVYVAGLEETKVNVTDRLTLSPSALTFSNKDVSTSIPRERIVNVFIGDQRTEPRGTTGKIARKVIPHGGGEALATITNKKADLLTVEHRDIHNAYHGVVFVLPIRKAAVARDQILANLAPLFEQQVFSCAEPLPGTVLVSPIQVSGIELPAEYRALIYEQLIKELIAKQPQDNFVRIGARSSGPRCVARTGR